MMTAQEKASELVGDFRSKILLQHSAWNTMTENSFPMPLKFAHKAAIQCALMTVDLLIESSGFEISTSYWRLVKEEIALL